MGVRQLQSTPWHIERFHRAEDDNKRDKRRCSYYAKEKSYCVTFRETCRGSAHCGSYIERVTEDSTEESTTIQKQKSDIVPTLSEQIAGQLYPIGARVRHKKWGLGTVKDYENSSEDIIITVRLYSGSKIKVASAEIVKDESLIIL